VRYFGGVKLGAGGLVRAYTDAIATALMQAERVERIARTTLTLVTNYADEARIRRWIDDGGYTLVDAAYDGGVTLTVRLPVTDEAAARGALRDLTQGRVVVAS
jgi:putative IMPACT (imprinted ancient) family translation regulator